MVMIDWLLELLLVHLQDLKKSSVAEIDIEVNTNIKHNNFTLFIANFFTSTANIKTNSIMQKILSV